MEAAPKPQAFEDPVVMPQFDLVVATIEELQNDAAMQRKFAMMLKNLGFAFVKLGVAEAKACEEAYDASKKFFSMSASEKAESAMMPALDVGYVHLPNVKEHLQLRATTDGSALFSSALPSLFQSTQQFYTAMMRVCRASLRALEVAHSLDAGDLTTLMDSDPLPPSYRYSSSLIFQLFRYFHYFARSEATSRDHSCAVHTDVGLLSVVPVSNNPALTFLHPRDFYRIKAEKLVPTNEPCAIVFGGDSLEYVTRTYYSSSLHSVDLSLPMDRYSLVFLMRARPDAFKSPHLTFGHDLQPTMTAAEYMRKHYLVKQSQNLAEGLGRPDVNLQTIKLCHLSDPTLMARYIAVGHVSRDVNIIKDNKVIAPGGGVFFSSVAATHLGLKAEVITKCSESDRPLFAPMDVAGVKVTYLHSPDSTSCQNEYPSDNPEDRRQHMKSLALPFTREDLKGYDFSGAIVHVNPLWYGEFPPSLLAYLHQRSRFLICDMQGFLRHVDKATGAMEHRPMPSIALYLPFIDLLKIDSKEAKHLCGTEDLKLAAKILHEAGAKRVIATQADKVVLMTNGKFYEAPFGSYPMEGRTGRGDTVTVSYVASTRTTKDPQTALTRAAEITTAKMQYPGPYRGPQARL